MLTKGNGKDIALSWRVNPGLFLPRANPHRVEHQQQHSPLALEASYLPQFLAAPALLRFLWAARNESRFEAWAGCDDGLDEQRGSDCAALPK